jgi:soluble lytic murein transglycosylase-like protein
MRSIWHCSAACSSFGRPSISPSRANLKAPVCPIRRQQQNHIHARAWSSVCLRSLRAMPIMAVVSTFAMPIVTSFFFEARASAQNLSHADLADRFAEFIAEASNRFVVPARWIRAVMQIESGGDEQATSPRGAMGLMQIMPGTWIELSARYGLGLDPFDPHDNILAGTAYLKERHDRFGSVGFLAAYHAGPLRYEQHLTRGRPLPPETSAYVEELTPLVTSEQNERDGFGIRPTVPWRKAPLFIERAHDAFADDQSAAHVQQTSQSSDRLTAGSATLAPPAADLFVGPSSVRRSE